MRTPNKVSILVQLILLTIAPLAWSQAGASSEEKSSVDESTLSDAQTKAVETARRFSTLVRSKDFGNAQKLFEAGSQESVTIEYIESAWVEIEEQCGAWKADKLTSVKDVPQAGTVVELTTEFEKRELEFGYVCNPQGEILNLLYFLDAPPDAAALLEEFSELIIKEEYEEVVEMFDSVMKGLMTAETLKQASEQFEQQLGVYKGYDKLRYLPNPVGTILLADLQYENGELLMQIVFNENKEIAGWAFFPLSEVDVEGILSQSLAGESEVSEP